jgi:hypothetical protein
LNITSNILVNCTNALRRKASFTRPADNARQQAHAEHPMRQPPTADPRLY